MSSPDYVELIERTRDELDDLERCVKRALRAWSRVESVPSDQDAFIDSAALNLHSFYTGLERIFQLIARYVDKSLPSGDAWHLALLKQMSQEWQQTRPAVISLNSAHELDEFRRFRHVVRNVYAENLIPEKMENLLTVLPNVWQQLRAELLAFADFLEILNSEQGS